MRLRYAPMLAARSHRAASAAAERRPSARLEAVAQIAGVFAVLVGGLVLIGWWVGIQRFTQVRPTWPPMMANTALMSLLAGTALIAQSRSGGTAHKQLAVVAAVLLTSIAAVTLCEWLFGWSAGIDRLLTPSLSAEQTFAGRPAPQTALTFLLLGPALALLDRSPRRGPAVSELLVLIAMAVPILALLGYAYGVSHLYGVPILLPYTGMAVPTAVTLIVLGAGVFFARPASGLMGVLTSPHAGGVAARRTLLALIALPLASFVVVLGVRQGLYPEGVGTGLVVFVALLDGLLLLLATSGHLERKDVALRQALAESEQWKLFFEHADWGAAISVESRFRLVNTAFAHMHGLAVEDMLGTSVFDMFPPEVRADIAAKLPLIEQRGTLRFEADRLRSDGSRFPALIDITAVKDAAGRVQYRAAYMRDISEEKKGELDRARLASLIESTDDGVIASTLDGTIVHWNRAAEHMYGYKADEIIGRPLSVTVPEEGRPELHRRMAALARGERFQGLETQRLRKDGTRFDAAATISPIIDRSGKIIGASAIVRDISERLAAQRALARAHEVEHALRTELEEITRASVAISEAVADLPRSNLTAMLEILVRQAQSLTAADYVALGIGTDPRAPFETWVSVGVPDEQARAIGRVPRPVGVLGAVSREGTVVRVHDVHAHPAFGELPAGHPPIGAFLAVPLRYQNRLVGNLYMARRPGSPAFSEHDQRLVTLLAARAGTAIETGTVYVSEALQREWLQALVDQMPEAVIVLDADGQVALQNRPALELAQESSECDQTGRPLSHDMRFPSGERAPAAALPHYRALRSEERVLGAEFVIAKNDRRVPVIASATPVHIGKRVVGAIAVFQDVSALKELERQRQEWISVVAHDLRQPISTISLATERLLQREPEELDGDRQSLERIQKAVGKLGRMIGDLLDASRLAAHRLTVEREPVNLRAALEEVAATVPELGANSVELSFPEQTPWVSADRMRLDQILRNLLSNAGKYGTPGTPVEIAVAPKQGWFEITVRNHGQGIAREDMAHLFERFGRSEASKRSGIAGIGLGLYITRGLVEAHGGRVWAESVPGESATFHVVLPALAQHAQASAP